MRMRLLLFSFAWRILIHSGTDNAFGHLPRSEFVHLNLSTIAQNLRYLATHRPIVIGYLVARIRTGQASLLLQLLQTVAACQRIDQTAVVRMNENLEFVVAQLLYERPARRFVRVRMTFGGWQWLFGRRLL